LGVLKIQFLLSMEKIKQGKSTDFKPSEQVIAILQEKGLSKIFNYPDYEYFKRQCKHAFNLAQAIADLFIEYNSDIHSDFAEYVF